MTAEVAVMNKSALSMAADSAVTIESYDKHGPTEKVFNTANKIFALSKQFPVAVMFYNATELGGVPIETIVKAYRASMSDDEPDNLFDYADKFVEFINNNRSLFPEDHERQVIKRIIYRHAFEMRMGCNKRDDLAKRLSEYIDIKQKKNNAINFDDDFLKLVKTTYKDLFAEIFHDVIPTAWQRGQKNKFIQSCIFLLTKSENIPVYSGIVIGGFGKCDFFPKLREYIVDTVVCGRLKYSLSGDFSISEESPSIVIPFAQTDAVQTILDGINPQYSEYVTNESLKMIRNIVRQILDNIDEIDDDIRKQYMASITPSLRSAFRQFVSNMAELRFREHTHPILTAIEAMPMSELATVAETLINLTHIRQRMSLRTETVGGPVDVLVVSKGDGLIWIKRKHYFSSELNHAFFTRYFER